MNAVTDQPKNRVDAALDKWSLQEKKYVEQYGKSVYTNKDFMKVRMNALQKIYDDHKGRKSNFQEKMDLQIMKGQIKQLEATIYSNSTTRRVRAVTKWGVNFFSRLGRGGLVANNKVPRVQPLRAPQMRVMSNHTGNKQHHDQSLKVVAKENNQVMQRRRPTTQRIIIENNPAKGLKR